MGVTLFLAGVFRNGTLDYWYLPLNLLLGLIPLGAVVWLRFCVGRYGWKNWRTMLLSMTWLLFLPNSFYIVTDFIHLPEVARVDMVQDVVMLMHFSILGLLAGFTSVYMLHSLALNKVNSKYGMMIAIGMLY